MFLIIKHEMNIQRTSQVYLTNWTYLSKSMKFAGHQLQELDFIF